MQPLAEPLADFHHAETTVSEEVMDYLERQIPRLSAAAVDVAYWQALAAGEKVLISGESGIYQAFPDGTRKLVKPLPKPLSVPVGTRVKIR